MLQFSVPTAITSAALVSGVLATALFFTSRLSATDRALGWWAAAFVCNTLRHLTFFLQPAILNPRESVLLTEAAFGATIVFLLGGAYRFFHHEIPRKWLTAGFAGAVAWNGAAVYLDLSFFARTAPLYTVGGIALIAAGWPFLRQAHAHAGVGYLPLGLGFVAWGLHIIDYPFLRPIEWFAPWGFLLNQAIVISMAIGLLLVTQRREEFIAREASRRAEISEASLAISEKRIRDFAEVSSDWFWEMGPDLRFTYMSERLRDVTGADPAATIGKRREEIADTTSEPEKWRSHLDDLEAHRPFRDFIYKLTLPGTAPRFIRISGRPLFDETGRFCGYRGTGSDVSAEVEREQQMSRQAALLQALLENLPIGITVTDRNLNVVAFNRIFLEALDFPLDRFRSGDPFEKFIRFNAERGDYGPGDPDEQVRDRLALAAHPKPHRFERIRPDGRIIDIRGNPLPDGGFVTTYTDMTEQRAAEIKLKASEAQLRDFAESTADWFWERDVDLRFTYISPAIERFSGLPQESYIGRTRLDIPSDAMDSGDWARHIEHLKARKPFRDFRITRQGPDGRMLHFSISGRPAFDENGTFKGFRGSGQDITSRIEAEARAALAQSRLVSAIEGFSDGLALFDKDDRLIICNRAYRQITNTATHILQPGVTFEALLRTNTEGGLFGIPPEEREKWIVMRLESHRNPGEPIELEYRNNRWLLIRDERLSDGGTIVVATDITEARRREADLADKTALLQRTLENMGEGIAVYDRHMRLISWNERLHEITGIPTELLRVGTSFEAILRAQAKRGEYGDVDVEAEVRRRVDSALRPEPGRHARWSKTGRYIEVRRNPMPGGGWVTLYSDLTDRKRAEDAIREAKEQAEIANRTKTEFFANMSHELRTPLNAIIGFSEIIQQELFGPIGSERYKEYAHDIYDSGTHLLTLINDILDVSKAEAGKIELSESVISVDEVIKASIRLINARAKEADVRLSAVACAHLPRVRVDERRLKQILLNLLSNAVKFTPAGGRVAVEAMAAPTNGFYIKVSDTGIGMSPEDIPKALAPFGQIDSNLARKYDGTGLGLPLTKALVELHGGRLVIDSTVGVGTTVTITLPPNRVVA
ncbi:MAG: PAS-domain containing protein [Rhodospirillales bacterium]|nr:PAS-domain containing protein [Rhodospirillales bacterium]